MQSVVHLLDDFALGGVTKALSLYSHSELAAVIDSRTEPVSPGWAMAPRLRADTILVHFPPSWRTLPFLVSLRARNRQARLIHIAHSYSRAWELRNVPNPGRFRTMLKLAFRLFDDVVAVSLDQARWLAEAGEISLQKLHVIEPWSGTQGLDALEDVADKPTKPLILGAYGRFDRAKGFDILIDAMKMLDEGQFLLLLGGFGPEDEDLRRRAAAAPNIEFLGRIEDAAAFVGRCDVIVVPSRWEPFGLVATEAKLGGRPIITANVDGLPEQVGAAGLVANCTNATALAHTLATLPTLPLAAMGCVARQSVRDGEAIRIKKWKRLFRGEQRYASQPSGFLCARSRL
jgi:glycosyltransferase involved in cell wall biosynthesis